MGVAIVYLMIIHDSAESSKLMRVSIEKREELIRDSKVEGRIFSKTAWPCIALSIRKYRVTQKEIVQ